MEINRIETESKGSFYIGEPNTKKAEMTYSKAGENLIIIDHTEVSDELRGQGIGEKLVKAAVTFARNNNFKIMPLCPFANAIFKKTPEIRDVLK